MRHLLLPVALGSAVALSGCCIGGPDGACVVETVWGQSRCEPIVYEGAVCLFEPAEDPYPPPPPSVQCGGAVHDGTCPSVGFTVQCSGGYYVRPGAPC